MSRSINIKLPGGLLLRITGDRVEIVEPIHDAALLAGALISHRKHQHGQVEGLAQNERTQ